ncbi:hypothetical protein D3C87_1517090 [compost metagenome]
MGATLPPLLRVRLRLRYSTTQNAAATAIPSSKEVIRRFSPAKTSGIKPELIAEKAGGKGPIDCPWEIAMVAPRKINMPAKVTMNDGMPQTATQ